MARKITVTLPDGTTQTRRTERPYTHVVVARLTQTPEQLATFTAWVNDNFTDYRSIAFHMGRCLPAETVWRALTWTTQPDKQLRSATTCYRDPGPYTYAEFRAIPIAAECAR